MSDLSNVKVGDKVRVTLEGTVNWVSGEGAEVSFDIGTNTEIFPGSLDLVEVTIIPPPTPDEVVYQPGDVVQYKNAPTYRYLLTTTGYVALRKGGPGGGAEFGKHYETDPGDIKLFTSKLYELVVEADQISEPVEKTGEVSSK